MTFCYAAIFAILLTLPQFNAGKRKILELRRLWRPQHDNSTCATHTEQPKGTHVCNVCSIFMHVCIHSSAHGDYSKHVHVLSIYVCVCGDQRHKICQFFFIAKRLGSIHVMPTYMPWSMIFLMYCIHVPATLHRNLLSARVYSQTICQKVCQ